VRLRLAALALVGALAAGAAPARAAEAPIPPPPARWVTDTAGMMSPAARDALDQRLAAYQRQTGHQVLVWIGETTGDTPLDEFAVRTFQRWKLGRAEIDDGLLVLVLRADRKIAIEVGYGLEERVPDARAGRIIRDVMAPGLRAGDADAAITGGVDALLAAIEGKPFTPPAGAQQPEPQPPPRVGGPRLIVYGLLAVVLLVLMITHPSLALYFLASIFSGGRGGWGGGGGGGGGFGGGGGGSSGGGGARGGW
jgi:uncharacterized protein